MTGDRPLRDALPGETQEMWDRFKALCDAEYALWRETNPVPLPYVWNPIWWFDRIDRRSQRWCKHINGVAIDYWRAQGFRWRWLLAHQDPTLEPLEPTS